ncbi:MAG: LytTR family DNA-binding domain-containing protein [Cytophagales bacterium]|nr:LytTR family DNA-binding domain-containing protein [Cytophagales bacterium]
MTINCVVIDDEYPARILMKEYIGQLAHLKLLGTFANPIKALDFLHDQAVHLIFLDIQMPELTGLEFINALKTRPMIILTTAYADYALEGYKLDVVDYLLKPIQFDRFYQSVAKARGLLALKSKAAINEKSAQYDASDHIVVKADRKIYRVLLEDIYFIQGLREYVTFYTVQGKIISLDSLKRLEKTLPDSRFMRVHKSYIINKLKVESLQGNTLIINNSNIPFSKNLKDRILKEVFG